ncbi:MAG TPA: ATP-grasp domain-containing protein [Gemmatimonadales bacterium]|nr:ATP-grasp domain-containing protein [Gemmatimonadales bacterium]
MKATVLVTDGEQRAALAVVRSLGRAGLRPVVCSTSGRSLAGRSRYAAVEVAVPDPLREPGSFADAVAQAARREQAALVLPIAEPAMLAILAARDTLLPARVPFPSLETFRRVSDKALLMQVAPEVGIRVPTQWTATSPASAEAILAEGPRFPLVLKPSRSVGEGAAGRQKLSVRYAAAAPELQAGLAALPPAAFPVLVQERIVGPGIGIFLLLWNGATQAIFAHRRIREKPPAGGVSVYRESVPADPGLVGRSRALLERLGWDGVAMIEYKVDAATGEPYLMEINGRFWGSLQLAIDAGVDFPALLVSLALGGHPAPVTTYRTGVRSRWWWGDVDSLLLRLRRSPASLALPPGDRGRWHHLVEFLKLWRPGDRNEILRLEDPMPFFHETREWLHGR